MCSEVGEDCSRLVCHWVYDAEQGVRECHTCHALCVVHRVASLFIAIVWVDKVSLYHLDSEYCEWVGVVAVACWDVCLDSVCHCVHTCVGDEFLRHSLCQCWVNDCNIWSNLEISKRELDTLLIISDDWEGCYLCCCTWCWWHCAEMSLVPQLWKTEHLAHVLECGLRMLVFYPHCFCCIYWWATAYCNNPVWLELLHKLCSS